MKHIVREHRLCHKGDFGQLGRDIGGESWVMKPFVAVTKAPNALIGSLSSREAEPLGTSGIKFMARDVRSAVGNLFEAGKNLVTLHPLKAAGNVLKGAMDATDIPFDALLDAGSAIAPKLSATRSEVSHALAA